MNIRERRRLGFTRIAVIRSAWKLSKARQLPQVNGSMDPDARIDLAEAIAADIMGENLDAWGELCGDDPQGFMDELLAFIEMLMPLILKILALFGL
jgi:hypothetical protein